MKSTFCFIALLTVVATASPSDYVNFVRQVQSDSGVEWDVSVAPTGTMLSPEGVGLDGSLFQLWSIHSLTANEYHLDEEFVSAYTPNAAIEIQTGDPYTVVPRTRVDQPYTVRVSISGLKTGNGAPVAAGQVLLNHAAGNYPAGQHSFNGTGEHHTDLALAAIDKNGPIVLSYPFTSLTGPDLTKVEGEEVWSVRTLDGGLDGTPYVEGEILESATLQVWPLADAAFSGIDPGETYENVPTVTVTLNDLYPDSTTFVRVYAGLPTTNPEESVEVQSSYVIIDDSIPQNRILTMDDLDKYFPKAGAYTMEVLHTTPFGTEILDRLHPVTIERTIQFRGSVNTSE